MLRLAIVGAGIGGCSAAYFTQSLVPDAEITIFEAQNRVGGRIFSSKIGSATGEMGATFFLPINKNMQALVEIFGLRYADIGVSSLRDYCEDAESAVACEVHHVLRFRQEECVEACFFHQCTGAFHSFSICPVSN